MHIFKPKSFINIFSKPFIIFPFIIFISCKVNAESSQEIQNQSKRLLLKVSFEISAVDDEDRQTNENVTDLKPTAENKKILDDHLPVIESYFQSRAKRDVNPLLSLTVFATTLVTIDKVYDLSGAPKMSDQEEHLEWKFQDGSDKFQHFKLGEISYLVAERVTGSPTMALAIGALSSYVPEIVENPAYTGGKNDQDVIATSLGVLTKYLSEQFLNGAFVTGLKVSKNPNSFSPDFNILNISGTKSGGAEFLPSTFTLGLNLNKLTGKKDILGISSIVVYYELDALGGGEFPIFPF